MTVIKLSQNNLFSFYETSVLATSNPSCFVLNHSSLFLIERLLRFSLLLNCSKTQTLTKWCFNAKTKTFQYNCTVNYLPHPFISVKTRLCLQSQRWFITSFHLVTIPLLKQSINLEHTCLWLYEPWCIGVAPPWKGVLDPYIGVRLPYMGVLPPAAYTGVRPSFADGVFA